MALTFWSEKKNTENKRVSGKRQTAIGSLGSMNSTEAAPIGDIISPTTVGFYTSHK